MTLHSGDVTTLMLSDQRQLWVDADAFEAHLALAMKAEREGQDILPLLEAAQEIATGEFLEVDLYQDWAQSRHRVLDAARRRLLHHLADLYIQRELFDQAEASFQTFLVDNPTDEDALCRLIALLTGQGRRQEALRLYKRTVRVMQEELQARQSARTRELVERIRSEPIIFESTLVRSSRTRSSTGSMIPSAGTPATRRHAQAIDQLIASPGQNGPEMTAQHWLLTTLNDLTHLLDAGWTMNDIIASLQTSLTGLTAIPATARRHLLRLAGSAMLGEPFFTVDEHTPPEDPSQLAAALAQSNAAGWTVFNTSSIGSVWLTGQIQLQLLQQLHNHLPIQTRPFLYSGGVPLDWCSALLPIALCRSDACTLAVLFCRTGGG